MTKLLPGVALTAGIAALAFALRYIPGVGNFSPMILAIILGMALHNILGTPKQAHLGVNFTARRVLRFAIILLGLQLTLAQVAEIGVAGLGIIVAVLIANFVFTKWLGRLLEVDWRLAELIGAGTSICGASAGVATNTVTGGSDEDVAYAVACVTIFGSIAMFAFPLLQAPFELDAASYGLWTGSSIHEIAQVVAASFQAGEEAGHIGTIAKLSRVVMLAPLVISLGLIARARLAEEAPQRNRKAPPVPWFVVGFIAMIGFASLVAIPPVAIHWIATTTTFLLSAALAGLGLETSLKKLVAKGLSPIILGAASACFIATLSLVLIKAVNGG